MTPTTTALTLSARPHVLGSRWGSSPDLTRPVVLRLLEARQQVQRQMWAARSEVIVAQLRVMRMTYP